MIKSKATTDTKEILAAKAVRVNLANARHATAKTKKRGEVSGGGKKPFRQKGTGRARAGSNRSPIWRGGGITFGPTGDQNFQLSINKKEKQAAKKAALQSKKSVQIPVQIGSLKTTKAAASFLKKNDISENTLIFSDSLEVKRVFGNIPWVKVSTEKIANVRDILWAKNIITLENKTVQKAEAKK